MHFMLSVGADVKGIRALVLTAKYAKYAKRKARQSNLMFHVPSE
jgi:hypothetical protein